MEMGIKTCPFCGAKARSHQMEHENPESKWFICCSNNHCEIGPRTNLKSTEQGAINIWNDRVC